MCKIKGKVEGCTDVKRFYLPGIEIETQCPKCSEIKNWKGRNEYLSYPVVGSNAINFYCDDCDLEWEVEIQLDIMVKIDSP